MSNIKSILLQHTNVQLKEMCKNRNIHGYSKLNKEELVKILKKNIKYGGNKVQLEYSPPNQQRRIKVTLSKDGNQNNKIYYLEIDDVYTLNGIKYKVTEILEENEIPCGIKSKQVIERPSEVVPIKNKSIQNKSTQNKLNQNKLNQNKLNQNKLNQNNLNQNNLNQTILAKKETLWNKIIRPKKINKFPDYTIGFLTQFLGKKINNLCLKFLHQLVILKNIDKSYKIK